MSISTRLLNFRQQLASIRHWQGARATFGCFGAGALLSLAFAPFYWWPVIPVSLGVFYLLLNGVTSAGRATLRGFFFGYGYFMAGTWWIANALMVDPEKFGWLIPFSILGLSAVMALWFALFGWLSYRLRHARLGMNLCMFAVLWVTVEYLRSIGIFGFPWNLLGYAALASLPVAQLAAWSGTFGLSLLVLALGLMPMIAILGMRRRWLGLAMPLLMVFIFWGAGEMRLAHPAILSKLHLRIVQPDIAQSVKGTHEGQEQAFHILNQLSDEIMPGMIKAGEAADTGMPDVTLWPESARPALSGTDTGMPWLASKLLLTGTVRVLRREEGVQIFNSLVAIDSRGRVEQWYDKHQLVPFGEFVPLRSVLPLQKITPGDLDFSRGAGVETLSIAGIPPFSPLVCYEVIFPWMAADAKLRPSWIVNVTNDGWYGNSPGPYQHLAAAQMRAIEQGLPLVRAANNGISAVIDPYGRLRDSLALDQRGILDAYLPEPLPPTAYARYGETPILIILILFIFAAISGVYRKKS